MPRHEEAGHVFFGEREECLEIIFAIKGAIGIGFEINGERRFSLRKENGCVVGGFNVTFFSRSNYIWKCLEQIEGFFLYKHTWLELLDKNEKIAYSLKTNILSNYLLKVRSPLERDKNKAI